MFVSMRFTPFSDNVRLIPFSAYCDKMKPCTSSSVFSSKSRYFSIGLLKDHRQDAIGSQNLPLGVIFHELQAWWRTKRPVTHFQPSFHLLLNLNLVLLAFKLCRASNDHFYEPTGRLSSKLKFKQSSLAPRCETQFRAQAQCTSTSRAKRFKSSKIITKCSFLCESK